MISALQRGGSVMHYCLISVYSSISFFTFFIWEMLRYMWKFSNMRCYIAFFAAASKKPRDNLWWYSRSISWSCWTVPHWREGIASPWVHDNYMLSKLFLLFYITESFWKRSGPEDVFENGLFVLHVYNTTLWKKWFLKLQFFNILHVSPDRLE